MYIGKEVVISNKLGCFPYYSRWVIQNTDGSYFYAEGTIPENGAIGKVVLKCFHETREVNLYGIVVEDQLYIMEEGSFKLRKTNNKQIAYLEPTSIGA